MAKRKKYPKLPNKYGSIKWLGKGRRNPYGVYPPVTKFNDKGHAITPKALCYVDDWLKGFAILTSYKAGTYKLGQIEPIDYPDRADDIIKVIMADYGRLTGRSDVESGLTFKEVYDKFFFYKYEREGAKKYSNATKNATKVAFKNCSVLNDRIFSTIRHDDLQSVIDNCTLKHASLELIVGLMHQMYRHAIAFDYAERDYSANVKINIEDDDVHGKPFTEEDLKVLWKNKNDETVEMLLIMCYSGYRVSAYPKMETFTNEGYFKGGVKTRTSIEREVPIHSGILELVKKRLKRDGTLMMSTIHFRKAMYEVLERLDIKKHTPHDCRHTFSMLCEKYKVAENDRKRMLGHSFEDITNSIYGHRTIDDLRTEIEKIKVCC